MGACIIKCLKGLDSTQNPQKVHATTGWTVQEVDELEALTLCSVDGVLL